MDREKENFLPQDKENKNVTAVKLHRQISFEGEKNFFFSFPSNRTPRLIFLAGIAVHIPEVAA